MDANLKAATAKGESLIEDNNELEFYINSGVIHYIHKDYNLFSKRLADTEKQIGKVKGSANRSYLNLKYVRPAKVNKERVIYEVSQYRLLLKIQDLLKADRTLEAMNELKKLDRLKGRALDIKTKGNYAPLHSDINDSIRRMESKVRDLCNNQEVHFKEAVIEERVRGLLGGVTGPITRSILVKDLDKIKQFSLASKKINDFSDLKWFQNLSSLSLSYLRISDISFIKDLPNLYELDLHNNQISDISPLSKHTNLREIVFDNNNFEDITPLSKLPNIVNLSLGMNKVQDISSLGELQHLTVL